VFVIIGSDNKCFSRRHCAKDGEPFSDFDSFLNLGFSSKSWGDHIGKGTKLLMSKVVNCACVSYLRSLRLLLLLRSILTWSSLIVMWVVVMVVRCKASSCL